MDNKIISEEPINHWWFLSPKDKRVLDLGCGKFYSTISTAEWFLLQRAKLVIGVDLGKEIIDNIKLISYAKQIRSSEDLEYFLKYDPEIIKCDIEGAEIYFNEISKMPDSVNEIGIEYHDKLTKEMCERKFIEWGFNIVNQYQLFEEDINRIGVYHAKK